MRRTGGGSAGSRRAGGELVTLCVLAALSNCTGRGESVSPAPAWEPRLLAGDDLGAVVARVAGVPIFAAEVRDQAQAAGQTRTEALATLVTFHLLAEKARLAGVRLSDRQRDIVKSAMVERLLERELEPSLTTDRLPETALRGLYEQAKNAFVHPRLVEIGILSVYTGPRMKPEPRARARQTAQELATFVAGQPPGTAEDLRAIARDPVWAARKVKFVQIWQGPDKPFSAALGAEALKLRRPGDTTGLIEDESGFHIARYVSERAPKNVSFDEARDELLEGYHPHWQRERFLELTDAVVRRRARIHAQEAVANEANGS